jgi:acetylglutamate kinase
LVNAHGSVAAGVSGLDGNLLVARPTDPRLGFVGDVVKVDPGLLVALLDRGFVPVVAPLARGEDGEVYNVNADAAASAIAVAMGASKLVYLTDVEGLYGDAADPETLISKLPVDEVEEMIAAGAVSGGMLPKVLACVEASRADVARVHILDGRIEHALLLEILTPEGIGTMITAEGEG